jgi:hypothetical protein
MVTSDVAPSDDPFWPAALRRGTRLPLSLRVGSLFSVAAVGALPEPSLPVAVAGSQLLVDSGVSGAATSSPNSLSFAANAVSTSWASDVVT